MKTFEAVYKCSWEEVNRGAQVEFDIARAIACFLMVACHVGIYLTMSERHPTFYHFMDSLGDEFAAPVFMSLLGACICFSRKNLPRQLFWRGVQVFFVGFLLSVCRGYIPYLFLAAKGVPFVAIEMYPETFLRARAPLDLDILHFAGLAFMAIALFVRLKISPVSVFLCSIVFSAVGELLYGVHPGGLLGNCICDLFWYGTAESYFPFLNWFIFPAFGYLFGKSLKFCSDKDGLYRVITPIGLAGVLTVYALIARFGINYYPYGTYYCMGVRADVMALFFVVFTCGVSYFIGKRIRPGFWQRLIARYSRNLTSIYCISYVIIGILVAASVVSRFEFEPWLVVALIPVVMCASDALAAFYKRFKARGGVRP